ncbi:MAG TPA: LLM class flavin-dependent oxidoreductase [Anaerolineae bacterium]|jgi:probable F420-dependent oxidoreductase
MKIGVALPTLENAETRRAPTYEELKRMALQIEAAGFDSLWLFDHLLYSRWENAPRLGVWDSWSILPALAEATHRIELGTLVTCVQFRNPALLAKMAASLDEISDGRFTLGIGAGWHEPEFTAFGVPYDHRVSRFEEAIQIIGPLLRTGRVDFNGVYYQAHDCEIRPRNVTTHKIPLMVGGTGPRMLELTARYADLWNTGYVSEMPTLADRRATLDIACGKVGRRPESIGITVHLPIVFEDIAPAPPFLSEYLQAKPDVIATRLGAYSHAGVVHVMLELFPGGMDSVEKLIQFAPMLCNRSN